MRLYTNQNFRIGLSTTKTLFKIKNLDSGHEIKINKKNLIAAYGLDKKAHLNKNVVLNGCLHFLGRNIEDLNDVVKIDKKRIEAVKKLQINAEAIKKEFFNEYHKTPQFKNLLGL